ncbi:MAG TPA: heparan-alpha-glucosaminide N-acetyltransferase domain-containing protein [Pseudonocardia sp.]|nr:heparan-alpha-glucosaminide N-acetyltransferase domain-containing protein [Pseudonocardia sp.]
MSSTETSVRGGTTATLANRAERQIGVDVARGVALLGMIAVHVFDTFDKHGEPTLATEIAAGRASTLFAFVAGISLAFLSGGRRSLDGRGRVAASVGIAIRGLLIGAVGLLLGDVLGSATDVELILPYYALLYLLAIPLLWLPPRTLVVISAGLIAVAPVVVLTALGGSTPASTGPNGNPTFATLFADPGGLFAALLVTGYYPVLAYLAYLCAGLAIGRLDLSSRRLATWLLGGGLAMAVTARLVSAVVLFRLGGLDTLLENVDDSDSDSAARNELLWDSDPSSSIWYLAVPSPHSTTPIDLLHTLGSAMAVLGAALLLCRVAVLARLLRPLAAAGAMTLTLYTAHLVVLATGVLDDAPQVLYVLLVVGALAFGFYWQRRFGQGPLERLVAEVAGRARLAVAARPARDPHDAGRPAPSSTATPAPMSPGTELAIRPPSNPPR